MSTKLMTLGAAVVALAAPAVAGIVPVRIDTNNLTTATAGGVAFGGLTHTGTLNVSSNANSTLNSIFIFGNPAGLSAGLASFSATINLVNGFVNGGSLSILATDGSQYNATISGAAGRVNTQVGQGFRIDGLTFSGFFSNLVGGTNFAGVNVISPLNGFGPYEGSFLLSSYGPNANGVDQVTQFETYIVPAPGAIMLMAAAGTLGLRRRR